MFKYSKDGISVLTVLDTRRMKRDGLYPVKNQVVYHRKQKYYTTGKSLSKKEWDNLEKSRCRQAILIRTDIENSFFIVRHHVVQLASKG